MVVATDNPHATHGELRRRFWSTRLLAVVPPRRRDAVAIVTELGGRGDRVFLRRDLKAVRAAIAEATLALPAIAPQAEPVPAEPAKVERIPEVPRPDGTGATWQRWYVAIYGEKLAGPVQVILTENPRETSAAVKVERPLYRQIAVEQLHPYTEERVRIGLRQAFKGEGERGGHYPVTAGRALTLVRTVIESVTRLGKKSSL
jgi:hypothetical protein